MKSKTIKIKPGIPEDFVMKRLSKIIEPGGISEFPRIQPHAPHHWRLDGRNDWFARLDGNMLEISYRYEERDPSLDELRCRLAKPLQVRRDLTCPGRYASQGPHFCSSCGKELAAGEKYISVLWRRLSLDPDPNKTYTISTLHEIPAKTAVASTFCQKCGFEEEESLIDESEAASEEI